MRQGRKSRTVAVLGCSLLVFAGCLAIAPGFAAAQGVVDEYTPGELPDPDSDEPGAAAGGSSGSDDDSSGSASPPVTPGSGDSGTDPNAAGPATEGEGDSGDESGGGKGQDNGESTGQGSGANDRDRAGASSNPDAATPALTSSSSDDGGAPVLLIVLAVVAAVCTGLAIWRMRRGDVADREAAQAKSGGGRVHGETSSP
jgi:cobalamin biosynthesis Mg chelatase CobN